MKGREGYGVRERVNERKSEIEKRKKERKKTKKMQGGENIIPICLFTYNE